MECQVGLQKCDSYSQHDVDNAIKKLLEDIGGISHFIKNSKKILLKPNIVKGMKPEECGTTHPALVEAVIKILKDKGCEVYVGDAPFADDTLEAMKISGIYNVCRKNNAKIAIFDKKIRKLYDGGIVRSEERRVGKECRSRWS